MFLVLSVLLLKSSLLLSFVFIACSATTLATMVKSCQITEKCLNSPQAKKLGHPMPKDYDTTS